MKKFNLFTERLDEYFSQCVESNKFDSDGKIEQTFQEIILPHALTEDSKLSLNSDNKFFVEIYEDEDGVAWRRVYTSEDITNEEYLLYQFRLSIVFETIEDEWINEKDENLKRIIKKLKIHDIYLHNIEQLKKILDIINDNNLTDNYNKEQIKIVKQYINKGE